MHHRRHGRRGACHRGRDYRDRPEPIPPAHTAAYVVSHVSSALASANTIGYSYTILRVASSSAPGERIAHWDYGGDNGRQRTMVYTAAGQPYSDKASTASPGRRPSAPAGLTLLDVEYTSKSAAREHFTIPPACPQPLRPSAGARRCRPAFRKASPPIRLTGLRPARPASCIRELLASGKATVAGHQRIGGADTIKIALTSRLPAPEPGAPQWHQTLWVNPTTYLPVQITTLPYPGDGSPYMHFPPLAVGSFTEAVTQFQWLPPTPANLAQLNAPVPPGFRVSG